MIQKGNLAIYESKRKGVKYPKPERPRPQILKLLTFWVQNTKTPTNIKNTILTKTTLLMIIINHNSVDIGN